MGVFCWKLGYHRYEPNEHQIASSGFILILTRCCVLAYNSYNGCLSAGKNCSYTRLEMLFSRRTHFVYVLSESEGFKWIRFILDLISFTAIQKASVLTIKVQISRLVLCCACLCLFFPICIHTNLSMTFCWHEHLFNYTLMKCNGHRKKIEYQYKMIFRRDILIAPLRGNTKTIGL